MTTPFDALGIVHAMPAPTFLVDLDGVVQAANDPARPAFCRDPGMDPRGMKLDEVLSDAWRRPLLRAIEEAKHSGHAQHHTAFTAADGGDAAWELWVRPIRRDDGALACLLLTAYDARESDRLWSTELRTLNEELRVTNEELQAQIEEVRTIRQADAERNHFLAMLAHELRNPLAAVASAVHLLQQRHVGVGDRQAEQALRIAGRQVKNQARLLDDLLEVSRVVLGKISLRLEPSDVVSIVRHAVDAAELGVQARALDLRVELPESAVVSGDAVRLEQVLTNLLGNAIKYTPPGGQIDLVVTTTADHVAIVVRDTGAGIDPQLIDRVFDLFTQAD